MKGRAASSFGDVVALLPAALLACACRGEISPAGGQGGDNQGTPHADPRVADGTTGCAPVPTRLWKLTPTQYSHTVQAILGDSAARAGDALLATLPPKPGFTN